DGCTAGGVATVGAGITGRGVSLRGVAVATCGDSLRVCGAGVVLAGGGMACGKGVDDGSDWRVIGVESSGARLMPVETAAAGVALAVPGVLRASAGAPRRSTLRIWPGRSVSFSRRLLARASAAASSS